MDMKHMNETMKKKLNMVIIFIGIVIIVVLVISLMETYDTMSLTSQNNIKNITYIDERNSVKSVENESIAEYKYVNYTENDGKTYTLATIVIQEKNCEPQLYDAEIVYEKKCNVPFVKNRTHMDRQRGKVFVVDDITKLNEIRSLLKATIY